MKEQNGKRLLAWLLSAMLLLSNLPFAFAQGLGEGHPEEASPGEGLEKTCADGMHDFVNGVCAACGTPCAHVFENGVCAVCGVEEPKSDPEPCADGMHDFENGVCTVCGTPCAHVFEAGVCTVCGTLCEHDFADGVCAVCGVEEPKSDPEPCADGMHDFENGVCAVCGTPCVHVYEDGVCTVCGTACTHDFADGVCTVCGAEEPSDENATGSESASGDKNGMGNKPEPCADGEHVYEDGVCAVCGTPCAHDFADGVCAKCGKKEPCADGEHVFVEGVCTVCGAPADSSKDKSEEEFTDDIMTLSREGECTHSDESKIVMQYRQMNQGYVYQGNYTHAFEFDEYNWPYCLDCNQFFEDETHKSEFVGHRVGTPQECYYDVNNVCAACEHQNDCTHPTSEPVPFECNKREYTPNGDGTHSYLYDLQTEVLCTTCHALTGDITVEEGLIAASEKCNFQTLDGTCWYCHGANPCKHEAVTITDDVPSPNMPPKSNGNGTHTMTYDKKGYCPTCETYVVLEANYKSELDPCKYYYNDNGECGVCGYVSPCTHTLTKQISDPWNRNCQPNGDGTHTLTYDLHTRTVCVTCGVMVAETVTEGVTETEPCYSKYGDDYCYECGAPVESVCEHTNRIYSWSSKRGAGGSSAKDNGDGTHTLTQTLYKHWTCVDCGYGAYDESGETKTTSVIEDHDIGSEGKCYKCTYTEEPCKHPNAYENLRSTMGDSIIARDEYGHTVEGWQYKTIVCPDCHTRLDDFLTGEKVTELMPHEFDENGQCDACGYVRACAHKNTRTYYDEESVSGTQIDATNHRVTFDRVQRVKCLDCEEVLSETVVETGATKIGSHDFEGGICSTCGYVKACDHARTSVDRTWADAYNYVSINAYQHSCTVVFEEDVRCLDCHQMLRRTYEPAQKVTFEHDFQYFDGIKKCDECGYTEQTNEKPAPACEHKNLVRYEGGMYGDYASIEPQADGHLVTYNNTYEFVDCADCGINISEKIIGEGKQEMIPHWFQNGKCSVCGYVNPCKHDGAKWTETYADFQRNLKDNGDGTHSMVVDVWTDTYCDLCGERLSRKTQSNQTVTEAHKYENGVCSVCHAKKSEPAPAPSASSDEKKSSGSGKSSAKTEEELVISGEMVKALQQFVLSESLQNADVVIESVGAEEILSATEYASFKQLSMNEQIYVMLITAGLGDAVNASLAAQNVTLSPEATALIEEITARMDALEGDEKQAMLDLLAKYFPIERIVVDGVTCESITLTFEVTANGQTHTAMFRFYYDESRGEWVTLGA